MEGNDEKVAESKADRPDEGGLFLGFSFTKLSFVIYI